MVEIKYRNARVLLGDADCVYEPAEDSFLLAEAGLKEAETGTRILEVGTGSGFVSAVLRANIQDIYLVATEINPHAISCARANGIEVIRTDLFNGIKPGKPENRFDLVLFNPPYLPTSRDEKVQGWLNYAFDGGTSGRETLDRFLDQVKAYLKPGGKILVLISSITGFEAIREKMEGMGFRVDIVARKKVSFEELMVIRGYC